MSLPFQSIPAPPPPPNIYVTTTFTPQYLHKGLRQLLQQPLIPGAAAVHVLAAGRHHEVRLHHEPEAVAAQRQERERRLRGRRPGPGPARREREHQLRHGAGGAPGRARDRRGEPAADEQPLLLGAVRAQGHDAGAPRGPRAQAPRAGRGRDGDAAEAVEEEEERWREGAQLRGEALGLGRAARPGGQREDDLRGPAPLEAGGGLPVVEPPGDEEVDGLGPAVECDVVPVGVHLRRVRDPEHGLEPDALLADVAEPGLRAPL